MGLNSCFGDGVDNLQSHEVMKIDVSCEVETYMHLEVDTLWSNSK